MKEEKGCNKNAGQLLSGTVMVVFVVLAAQFFAAPVAGLTPSSSASSTFASHSRAWAAIFTLTSPNAERGGGFGFLAATNGVIVIVGAGGENVSGQFHAGHAYIFNAETGRLISTLTSPNPQSNGLFGGAVAVGGNVVVVSAPGEDASAGRAYIYNAETGALISTLTSPNTQPEAFFGESVAASDDVVIVGAPLESANGQFEAGHAYAFNAKTGGLVSTLASPDAQSGGAFGTSVAARGKILVVGAPGVLSTELTIAGNAYIFNAETGNLISTLTSPNAQPGGGFGWSVTVRGNVVVVGAPFETAHSQFEAGHAYVFSVETGHLIGTLTSPNAQFLGVFGSSVAASSNILVVGASEETANGQRGAGHAYIIPIAACSCEEKT